MEGIRLQKYIASCGTASRRKAEEMIFSQRVKVNGKTETNPAYRVKENDSVCIDGRKINPEERKVYIILNKPRGYVTTLNDQFGRKTVIDLVKGIKERVYPIGRLDYNTKGLLILTNDGELTHAVTHPSKHINKVYEAVVKGRISIEEKIKFENGILIDGRMTSKAKLKIRETDVYNNTSIVTATIHEGRNRQIRKMFNALGNEVLELKRMRIGNIELGSLKEGQWKHISKKQIGELKNLCR